MIYRKLGKTGISVSEIAAGCEGLVEKPYEFVRQFLDEMEKDGINCLDLYAPNPDMRSNLGAALKGRREKFVLQAHICSVWKNGQYMRTRNIDDVKEAFEDQLKRLDTDHVEIGMVHYVDSEKDWETVRDGEVMKYALQLKKEGKISCIGLSSHNPTVSLAAVKSGLVDVLMFSINPCYDLLPASDDVNILFDEKTYDKNFLNMDEERQELYETCLSLGVGITVMKAFGGGDLLDPKLSPAGKALTPYQCLHYALSRPAVSCVMSGARTIEELHDCAGYENASEEQKD